MRTLSARLTLLCLLLFLLLPFTAARAHDARPVTVSIVEALPGLFRATLRVPPTVESGNEPALRWPDNCVSAEGASGLWRCAGGLAGRRLALDYPRFNPSLATYFSIAYLDGGESTAMLPPTEPEWRVPAQDSAWHVAVTYLLLGVEHIIGGIDHLLFVFGLLVIARTLKRVLWTITGFTLAHSLTLSLAALGLLRVPIPPVEAVIALSIVFLAYEIALQDKGSLTWRYPLLVSFGFGLLHGLGFASALGEIGLARNETVISLLFFNLGVELGQVGFIVAVMGLLWTLSRLRPKRREAGSGWLLSRGADRVAAYVIGIPATFWLFERLGQFV